MLLCLLSFLLVLARSGCRWYRAVKWFCCCLCCSKYVDNWGESLVCFSGTLSLTDNAVQQQLRRQLEDNPDVVACTRQRILAELDLALEKRGIGPVCIVQLSTVGTRTHTLYFCLASFFLRGHLWWGRVSQRSHRKDIHYWLAQDFLQAERPSWQPSNSQSTKNIHSLVITEVVSRVSPCLQTILGCK